MNKNYNLKQILLSFMMDQGKLLRILIVNINECTQSLN